MSANKAAKEPAHMRLNLVTATSVITLSLFTVAHAAEIDQDGANAVRDNLTKLLPEDLANSGFVTVNPAGTRYEVIYDFEKLLKKANPANFAINGLTPWSMFATPLDSGLWNVEGNNRLDVSGHFAGGGQPRTDFTYSIGSFVYNGVFDPVISYLRSGDFTAKDIKVTSKTETEQVNAGFGGMNYKLTSTNSTAAGRTDFAANGTLSTFSETVSGKEMPPVEIRADAIDFDAKVDSLPAKEIRDIVIFVLDHIEEKKLSDENSKKLKTLVSDAFPLFSGFKETINLNNLTVSSMAGNGGAKNFGYNFTVDGPSSATRLGVGLTAQQVSFNSPMVPDAYSVFLPDALDMQFGIPDMDFAAFSDEFMKVDFSKETSDDSGKKAAEKLFHNGEIVIDFPKVSAKSSVYDLDISGKIRGRLDTDKDYTMKATILARDYDKTIAAIQDLGKTNPDLNQVSLGMMMVKGFAKTDPDGRQRWDISVERDGSVNVNGQVLSGASKP
jgi:hypothetical protein